MIKPQTQLRHRPPLLLPYSSSFSSSFSSSRPGSLALCSLPLPAKLPSHHSFIHIDWCFRECHFLSSPTHHSTLRQRYVHSLVSFFFSSLVQHLPNSTSKPTNPRLLADTTNQCFWGVFLYFFCSSSRAMFLFPNQVTPFLFFSFLLLLVCFLGFRRLFPFSIR